MMIIGCLVIVGLIGIMLYASGDWKVIELGAVLSMGSILLLILAALFLPINIMKVNAEIDQFNAIKATVEQARANKETWELAAFQTEISKANRWLASTQYYNNTPFDIWIPDEIMKLEAIK